MKLEKLAPGMVVHDHGRARDIIRTKCSWPVEIVEVDMVRRAVLASWNNNPPQWFPEYNAVKWKKLSYWDTQKKKDQKANDS